MKKIIHFLLPVLFLCIGIPSVFSQEQFKMTTELNAGSELTFTVNYGIELNIDWGDGVFNKEISLGLPLTGVLKGNEVIVEAYDINYLDCSGQSLTELDVTGLSELGVLISQDNKLENIDVSNNKALKKLNLASNQIKSLNIAALAGLTELVVGNNTLTQLNLLSNKSLEALICNNNALTALAVQNALQLKTLWCNDNSITTLNLVRNRNLQTLMCQNNAIKTLNLTGLTELTDIWSNNNEINSLDLSSSNSLTYVSADNSSTTEIVYGNTNKLKNLYIGNNGLGYASLLAPSNLSNYGYSSQDSLKIPSEFDNSLELDLSSQLLTADEVATNAVFAWHDGGNTLTRDVDYIENGGKFEFKIAATKLYAEISSDLFPELPSIFTTTAVVRDVTGVEQNIVDKTLTVHASKGKLIINSRQEQAVHIYGINGALIHSFNRLVGQIELDMPHGVYFVNQHKVIL